MVDDNGSNAIPDTETLMKWAEDMGLSHPVCSDSSGGDVNRFVTYGYPTYVLIDRDMSIVNPDMWPFSESAVEELL